MRRKIAQRFSALRLGTKFSIVLLGVLVLAVALSTVRKRDMTSASSLYTLTRRIGGNGKHIIAKSEPELLRRLDDGFRLIQTLDGDKFLLEKA